MKVDSEVESTAPKRPQTIREMALDKIRELLGKPTSEDVMLGETLAASGAMAAGTQSQEAARRSNQITEDAATYGGRKEK
jgi:hypothetical protein